MKKNKLIINEENFRRYLENRMSQSERNRFERELQKHPFEAEAMDGYENTPSGMKNDLEEIKSRIGKRKRRNTYRYWAAAATVLLLVTAGLIWYQLGKEPPATEMAALESEKQEEKAVPVTDSLNEKVKTDIEKESEKITVTEPAAKQESKPVEKADAGQPKQEAPAARAELVEDEMTEQKNIAAKSQAAKTAQGTKNVSLDVTHEQPDLKARMKLKSLPSAQNSAIALTGKEEFPVDTNDIFPDSFQTISPRVYETVQEIQGVAVQDNAERRSGGYQLNVAAHPGGGMENYRKYLEKQALLPKNYPRQTETVKLLLVIDSRGNITDILKQNVTDSALYERSKSIIRSGPAWNPKIVNGQKIHSEVKLEIEFKKNKNE